MHLVLCKQENSMDMIGIFLKTPIRLFIYLFTLVYPGENGTKG